MFAKANLIASIATFLIAFGTLRRFKFSKFQLSAMEKNDSVFVASYHCRTCWGVVNETLDRQFLKYLLPEGESTQQMSIYGTVCRLVTFMTLFRQAYLMELNLSFFCMLKDNSGQAYSKLMTFFRCCQLSHMLLGLCANLEWIAHEYIRNKEYYSGDSYCTNRTGGICISWNIP